MYFDALTLAAVVDELRQQLVGGRIQRVVLPSRQSVAVEVYAHGRRHHLLLSAHPQLTRAHLVGTRPSRGVEPTTPLLLLLRKYVVGGRILAIEQPELERVMVLSIVKGPSARNPEPGPPPEGDEDLPDEGEPVDQTLRCELIAELMERRANVVLVNDDNIIMECVRHVTPLMSQRPVQPHEPYELPPRQNKLDPRHATAQGLRALTQPAAGSDLARALVAAYRGLSPQAAREVVFRACGRAEVAWGDDLPWPQLAAEVQRIWQPPWQPSLAIEDGVPRAFAPYLLTHYPQAEPQPSTSAALERYYAQREQLTSHQQRRDALLDALAESRERLERQRRQLSDELAQADALERLRWEGEMIFAFIHSITPGMAALEVEGRTITLDPRRSAVENAQDRFKAYDKARGALTNVPERLATTEARLAGLEQLQAMLALAEGYEAIEDMAREAVEQGYVRGPEGGRKQPRTRRQQPLRLTSSDGYTIFVGRSAGQNEQATFTLAAPDDIWLHVRGIPGAHVIIKSGGASVPERTVEEAAALAAYFSPARSEAAVDVELARRRLVRRIPGGPVGLVNYRAERTVRVAPRAPW